MFLRLPRRIAVATSHRGCVEILRAVLRLPLLVLALVLWVALVLLMLLIWLTLMLPLLLRRMVREAGLPKNVGPILAWMRGHVGGFRMILSGGLVGRIHDSDRCPQRVVESVDFGGVRGLRCCNARRLTRWEAIGPEVEKTRRTYLRRR